MLTPTNRPLVLSAAALVLAATLPAIAQAQPVGEEFRRDHNVAVLSRPRPDYRALGLRAGSFLIYPQVTAQLTADDHVPNPVAGPQSDTLATVIGEVHALSDWNVSALRFDAQVAGDSYSSLKSENVTTYDVSSTGRLDIQRDAALRGSVRHAYLAEDRTAAASQPADRPIRFDLDSLSLGGAKAFNRLRVTGSYDYRKFDYKDNTLLGAPLSESFRDHRMNDYLVRADYAVSPDTALLIEGRYNTRTFSNLAAASRNSHGYEVTVGADFEAGLSRGVIQLGYIHHAVPASVVSPNISGFAARAQVDLFPTQLITVSLRANRDIVDTGLLASPVALASSAGVEVDYELLRNLILTSRLDYEADKFQDVDRNDKRTSFSLGGKYLMNRHVVVNLLYSYVDLNSTGTAARVGLGHNRVSIGLTAQY